MCKILYFTYVALQLSSMPGVVLIPVLFLVGILTGVVIAFIPAIMERKFNANVVVVSLMLNSIVVFLAQAILRFLMRDTSISYPASYEIPQSVQLPKIFGSFSIQSGLIIAVVCVVAVSVLFYKTSFGWKMRLVGENPRFAEAVGLSSVGISFAAQLIGGGMAGIAGTTELLSNYTRFRWTISTQHGFDGLLVAVLAKKNPALVPVGAIFLAYIRIGADVVNSTGDIPPEFITVIQGIIILLIAAETFMSGTKNKLIFKAAEKSEKEKNAKAAA